MKYINGQIYQLGKLVHKDFGIVKGKLTFQDLDNLKETTNLKGMIVSPGFVDLHIHTRIPGFEYKEDLEHIDQALLAGGFTHAIAQSNTDPRPDNVDTLKDIQEMLKRMKVNVSQASRVTKDNKVIDIKSMSQYTKFFTDDGYPIKDAVEMKKAILLAKETNSVLILHEEDSDIKGEMYHCSLSQEKDIAAFNEDYESNIVKRDIELNKTINAKLHFQHLSTSKSIDLIVEAKSSGMPITAEFTPHHLMLDNENIKDNGNYKMNPPLPSPQSRQRIIEAFKNQDIDIIATDHAPHSEEEKDGGFKKSVNGIIGLETAFAVVNTLSKKHSIPIETIIQSMSINPGKVLGIKTELSEGAIANLVIIDPNEEWIFTKEDIKSKSNNTPFINAKFIGRVKSTIVNGKHIWNKDEKGETHEL